MLATRLMGWIRASIGWNCAALLLLLGACAADNGRYPSLSTRDVERIGEQRPALDQTATDNLEPPTASAAEISAIIARAQSAAAKFDRARTAASAAVLRSKGHDQTSPRYADALLELAVLVDTHSQTALAFAELDLLLTDAKTQFSSSETDLIAARKRVLELANSQDAAIAQLWEDFEK